MTRHSPVMIHPARAGVKRSHAEIGELREWAVQWAIGNGAAILAVGAALIVLLSWRARLVDDAATLGAAEAT